MPLSYIHGLWQKRKVSTETARTELRNSRGIGTERFLRAIEYSTAEESRQQLAVQATALLQAVQATERPFRRHRTVTQWLGQFHPTNGMLKHRFVSLLLRGESRSGKTAMAKSLFGPDCTLELNCQGCSPHLPSLRTFDRSKHLAIIWDEIDEQQVLQNKLVFQAGLQVITLGQSQCNQYAYAVFLHGIAMILCSNTFMMPHPSRYCDLDEEDEDWLKKNVWEAALPKDETWYEGPDLPGDPDGKVQFCNASSSSTASRSQRVSESLPKDETWYEGPNWPVVPDAKVLFSSASSSSTAWRSQRASVKGRKPKARFARGSRPRFAPRNVAAF